jgi:Mrp family chromosome partitioning ATPase
MDGWLAQHRGADLMLIEAPPLLHSIDGALVARACDGLILVAERGVTERRALQEAANRARAAGCTLLGVIVTSVQRPMPSWLERLAGPRRPTPSVTHDG